jgi:hypothetical protein
MHTAIPDLTAAIASRSRLSWTIGSLGVTLEVSLSVVLGLGAIA